ncbi:MAG: hypothetical protein ACRDRN_15450 [Sciscionella sp.]
MTELVLELKTLRKGRGIHAGQMEGRVGPALRAICGVADGDNSTEIRTKVANLLRRLTVSLPNDLRVAALAAFALEDGVGMQFYQDRVRWVANHLSRDERTARRRIDEGIDEIAGLAVAQSGIADSTTPTTASASWHTEEVRVALALDQPEPEAFEFRRIVADRDDLHELDLALTLTSPTGCTQPADFEDLHVDVFYGGRLVTRTKESADRFGFVLALSRALRRDERYEFLLRFRVPRGRVMQPHYVCVPKHRCDLFDLRVRFDLNASPQRVWKLADRFQRDVDDPVPHGGDVGIDDVGEIHARFRDLTPGLAYGVRWDPCSTSIDEVGQAEA